MTIYIVFGYNRNSHHSFEHIIGIYSTRELAQSASPLKNNTWDGYRYDEIRIDERWMVLG